MVVFIGLCFVFLSAFYTEDIVIVASDFMFDQNVGGVQVGEGWTSNFSFTMDDSYIFSFFKNIFTLACSDLCCTCCLAAVKRKPLFISVPDIPYEGLIAWEAKVNKYLSALVLEILSCSLVLDHIFSCAMLQTGLPSMSYTHTQSLWCKIILESAIKGKCNCNSTKSSRASYQQLLPKCSRAASIAKNSAALQSDVAVHCFLVGLG